MTAPEAAAVALLLLETGEPAASVDRYLSEALFRASLEAQMTKEEGP